MLKMFVSLFAGPLGAVINKALATGATAVVATSVAHGNPIGDVSNVVGMAVVALSTLISGFAATQGVQIPIINADDTNGVHVVSVATGARANAPLK